MLNAVSKECHSRCSSVENNTNFSSASGTSDAGTNEECSLSVRDKSGLLKASRCKRIYAEIKEGNNILHAMASSFFTVNSKWIEHTCGSNGGPA